MPHRRLLALLLLAVTVAGCSSGAAQNLREREVVAHFAVGASQAEHLAARRACTGLPNASPEPLPQSTLPSEQLSNVRFRVDNASDAQLARLTECLDKQPGVIGVDVQEHLQ